MRLGFTLALLCALGCQSADSPADTDSAILFSRADQLNLEKMADVPSDGDCLFTSFSIGHNAALERCGVSCTWDITDKEARQGACDTAEARKAEIETAKKEKLGCFIPSFWAPTDCRLRS